MNIVFIGQLGWPKLDKQSRVVTEQRTAVLAGFLADKGHKVTFFGTKPYIHSNVNLNGVQLIRLPSFDPQIAGGWLYLILSFIFAFKQRPEVIHVSGWRAGFLAPFWHLIFKNTIFVWTLDHAPRRSFLASKLAARIGRSFNAVTTPSRTLQYLLRNSFALEAQYVPDGYFMPVLKDISLKPYKLRRGQYIAAIVSTKEQLRDLIAAWRKLGLKKKILVLTTDMAILGQTASRYDFIQTMACRPGRLMQSILNGATFVINADYQLPVNTLLNCMHTQKAIVTVNNYYFQEYLGMAAKYYKHGDIDGLVKIWREVSKKPKQLELGAEAQKRAFNHFRWERIMPEYSTIYNRQGSEKVALDSAKRKFASPKAASSGAK